MASAARTSAIRRSSIPVSLAPMEARLVEELPSGDWQYEPKWDGFRCVAIRCDDRIELQAKSGKSLTRYFPEIVERLARLRTKRFVLDGELAIPVGESLSFDALQMRLHPAESRVRKLAAETPALLVLFDCPYAPGGRDLLAQPLRVRRTALEEFFAKLRDTHGFVLTPFTRERREAQRWLDRAGGALDGVVAKAFEGAYVPGERAMLKVKRMRTADCVVGGFRYATQAREVGSLLLGLYDDEGLLHHIGFTSSIPRRERAALTRRLEEMRGSTGFTGSAPGAPSRWSTERSTAWEPLRAELVVEVQYDHVTDARFRHGTKLVRWRPDKAPYQCTFEQLQREAQPSTLIRTLLKGSAHDDRRAGGSGHRTAP
jgi:ATP-dependent DNA ligase